MILNTPQLIATFQILTFLGLINAFYLFWKLNKNSKLVCPINSDCNEVVRSKWSKIFFIRNEILGIFFFLLLFFAIPFILIFPSLEQIILKSLFPISLIGLAFSSFLVYVQTNILKKYCFYCLISTIITFLIFLNSFLLLF
jgi:uncharacterized membrane protein